MSKEVPALPEVPTQHPFRLAWAVVDPIVWIVAIVAATWLRYDFTLTTAMLRGIAIVAGASAVIHTIVGFTVGPYRIGHLRGSFEEVIDLTKTVAITVAVVFVPVLIANPILVPKSVPVVAAALALTGMLGMRTVLRAYRMMVRRRQPGQRRIIVFGAGDGGRLLLRSIGRDRQATYQPVAILDDSNEKSRLSIEGVKVRGTREDLAAVATRTHADTLAIAVPSADSTLIRDLRRRAEDAGLDVLVLPSAKDMIGELSAADLRGVDLADLLGRRPIKLDRQVIEKTIRGRRILVTGAGGSIGSELCRQIAQFSPERLVLLDRDESALHAAQLSLAGNGLLESDDIVLADIRDPDALRAVFDAARPEVVFHAAALKHLPLLERYPIEAWKTNVLGTLNVLTAAAGVEVQTFVNISTDKAADPTCVLGYSKRLAERLTARFASHDSGTYVSVRFGNVLGSRGSVVPAFTAQIERGGPVTVTHPDVERYFMLIPEACQLTLQAAAIGVDGEVMVLDMGTPMKIVDVAKTLIAMSKRLDVEIVYTGLRPGEKMSEDLFSGREAARATAHPLVSAVEVPPIDPDSVYAAPVATGGAAMAWMRGHARTAAPGAPPAPRPPQPSRRDNG